MKKIKKQRITTLSLMLVLLIAVQAPLFGQDYLSKERENEIKISGNYFWGECSDFDEDMAKLCAYDDLSDRIVKDAVMQTIQQDEILKTIETGAHLDRLQQQGKVKILAWIAKDSVLLTVTTQRPITQTPATTPTVPAPVSQPEEEFVAQPEPEPTPIPKATIALTNNSVMQQLAACKTYNDVKRVAKKNGVVSGNINTGSKGFANPTECIIAVFTEDGALSALLDVGSASRIDLLSGNTVQNPEQYYPKSEYVLWYLQQKSAPQSEVGNAQNYSSSSSGNSLQAPPIENTDGYANANIKLPANGNGKSVLADGFVWIWVSDTKLQDKYNVHPCDGDDPDCIYPFWDDHEIYNNDETYYEYPLSPNIAIEAGMQSNSGFKTRKMTVGEFADYYNKNYSGDWGMVAKVTYKDGMITKIVEQYTP